MESDNKQCSAFTKGGTRCTRTSISGEDYCWQHQPKLNRWLKRITLGGIVFGILTIIGLFADLSGLGLLPKKQSPMVGDFRIAVAGFTEVNSSKSEIGIEYAQGVYLLLQELLDNLDLTISIRGPDDVGIVVGEKSDDRANFAAKLASEIGADLVIYGEINTEDSTWYVSPEFYVSTENFYEAQEITGQHILGSPIAIRRQGNIASRKELNVEFAQRIDLLSHIIIGLAYYSINDFEQSLTFLQTGEENSNWLDDEGKKSFIY